MTAIDRFSDEFAFLSNFAITPFLWDGRNCQTVEHAFQAAKAVDLWQAEWVLAAATPAEAKQRGRRVAIRSDWDSIRRQVMDQAVRAKFTDRQLAGALVATGDRLLVEGNQWHDNTWGDCRCGRAACSFAGANWLGEILMQVRAELTPPAPTRVGLDWSGASGLRARVGKPEPCIACGQPASLRAPISEMPLHKTCAEVRPDLAAHWENRLPARAGPGAGPAPF